RLAVLQLGRNGLVAEIVKLVRRLNDGLLDHCERPHAADVSEVRADLAALAADRVAVGAARLRSPENSLACSDIARPEVIGCGSDECMDEGDQLPGFVIREVGWRHVCAGQAVAHGGEDRLIRERMPQLALDEVWSAPAAAV